MLIPRDERSPRYFGAVMRACKGSVAQCPYPHKDDSRFTEWMEGYESGILMPAPLKRETVGVGE